jgi:hypothetical protein
MINEFLNPFEFEYNEQTDNVITKSNIKFIRNYENLDKTKEYIKINYSIYKIDKPVDLFTWLNEPDTETNYQIELYFEFDTEFVKLPKKLTISEKNYNSELNFVEFEELELNDTWFNCWYLNSRFATDKIKINDTYIPNTIEFIRFI